MNAQVAAFSLNKSVNTRTEKGNEEDFNAFNKYGSRDMPVLDEIREVES